MNEQTVPTQATRNGQTMNADGKGRHIGRDFTEQLGRLVILWGDIEALVRTLALMKSQGLNYRAKTDEELMKDYRRERRQFDKYLKAVLPHQTAMAYRILKLKDLRDFALHGTVIKCRRANTEYEKDAIIHVDASATIHAQAGFMSRPLESIVPRARKLERDDSAGAPILTTDELRRACDDLAGYVYDLRLFRTILQVKGGSELCMKVTGGSRGARKSQGNAERTKSPPQNPRCIEASVFQNPADVIAHDQETALRLGKFCQYFSLMGQTIRTLEIMRAGQPRHFKAHSDPKVEAWYNQSTRQLTAKLNFILGKNNRGARELAELVNFRNFIYHNPISLLGTGSDGYKPAFIHRDMVALRDARPRPDEDKNEIRPVPAWAIRQHSGTKYMTVDKLDTRTDEVKLWQERLLQLVEQGHRQSRNG